MGHPVLMLTKCSMLNQRMCFDVLNVLLVALGSGSSFIRFLFALLLSYGIETFTNCAVKIFLSALLLYVVRSVKQMKLGWVILSSRKPRSTSQP